MDEIYTRRRRKTNVERIRCHQDMISITQAIEGSEFRVFAVDGRDEARTESALRLHRDLAESAARAFAVRHQCWTRWATSGLAGNEHLALTHHRCVKLAPLFITPLYGDDRWGSSPICLLSQPAPDLEPSAVEISVNDSPPIRRFPTRLTQPCEQPLFQTQQCRCRHTF